LCGFQKIPSHFLSLYFHFGSLHLVRDMSKEKPLELEMAWLCEESGFKHSLVPKELVQAADAAGSAAMEGAAGAAIAAAAGAGASAGTAMEEGDGGDSAAQEAKESMLV
jgi:hypothetical protein